MPGVGGAAGGMAAFGGLNLLARSPHHVRNGVPPVFLTFWQPERSERTIGA